MNKKDIITITIVAVVVSGIAFFEVRRSIRETPSSDQGHAEKSEYAGISSLELFKTLDEDILLLVDVRTAVEYEKDHIPGAINIPIGEIEKSLDRIDRKENIILYCKSGPWSRQAYNILKKNGYTNVRVLTNGIVGWKWEANGKVVASR